jgi:hypothetical protein
MYGGQRNATEIKGLVLSVPHAVAAGGDIVRDIFIEAATRRYRVRY